MSAVTARSSDESWERFAASLRFAAIGDGFETLVEEIRGAEEELGGEPSLLHYLSLPPSAHAEVIESLREAGLTAGRTRIILEKPFGTDLASARSLDRAAARRLRGAAGIPHRPLPRPGRGPEPPRDAVRQRHVRAGLEPEPHRVTSRSTCRRRSGSACARPSTSRPAPFATWSSRTCSRCSASSRWSRRTRWARSS